MTNSIHRSLYLHKYGMFWLKSHSLSYEMKTARGVMSLLSCYSKRWQEGYQSSCLPKCSSFHILSTESNMYTLHEKRAKCQSFTHCPIDIAFLQQVMASLQDSTESWKQYSVIKIRPTLMYYSSSLEASNMSTTVIQGDLLWGIIQEKSSDHLYLRRIIKGRPSRVWGRGSP